MGHSGNEDFLGTGAVVVAIRCQLGQEGGSEKQPRCGSQTISSSLAVRLADTLQLPRLWFPTCNVLGRIGGRRRRGDRGGDGWRASVTQWI